MDSVTSFPDLKIAEYIASSSDFPNLRSALGFSRGVVFAYPRDAGGDYNETRRGGHHCLFETSSLVATQSVLYREEAKRFNQLLSNAKAAGFSFIVVTVEESWKTADEVVQKLLAKFEAGAWYPEPPDTYHDSGYFYSDTYIKTTPAFAYIEQHLQDCRPAIYADSRHVVAQVGGWVEKRRIEDPNYPYKKESNAS